MQNINSQTARRTRNTLKKLLGMVAAGAFIAAPLSGVIAPREAQAQAGNRETRTFEGVVVNDLSGRNFTLRLDNGQRILVQLDEREPQRLSAGDRVRVVGVYRRNQREVFRAREVRVIRNVGNNNANRTFTGRISNIESRQRFDLVVNGTTYNVITNARFPRELEEGDRVRVYGRRDGGNDIINATVVILNDGDNDNGNNNGDQNNRTFTGRVSNVESDQRFDLVVDGTTYNVISSQRLPRRLTEGDRVRVYGRRSGGNDIINPSIVILNNDRDNDDDDDDDDNDGQFATFVGRVTRVNGERRFDAVANNGSTFNITSKSRLPRELDAGDTVRVVGRRASNNDIVDADVDITQNR